MNVGSSSEKTSTSSSTTEANNIPRHVVNLKESKTHLFYVIQSDSECHHNTQHLVQLRISKENPPPKTFISRKMRLPNNNEGNRERDKRTQIPCRLASIHKRTDHPSFVVLPEVFSRRRLNIRQNTDKNQSTSENSNETYVIRSKNGDKTGTVNAGRNNLVVKTKTQDFCECDKGTANKSRNSSNLDDKIGTVGTAQNTSQYLRKEDLFNISYVDPAQKGMPQRLRAGQDYDRRYKSCYMCPNMTRIFPPESSRRLRTGFQSDSGSDATLNNRGGYAKINFKLVRQCLINGSANEKTEILDAIRMRMKSLDANVAISTIDDIVKFDLFGVQCECRSKPLLEGLLWPLNPSHQLQTSISQFVNALVSYKLGRSYFNNRSIIGMLTWGDIGRDNIDQIMGDNLMGIMMKLSFSRFQRTDMIKNGLIRWLLEHMQEEEYSASKYHLQCMAGLLRNLLRGFNLEHFSSTDMQKLIVLLGRYLEHEDETAKRYVCDSLIILFQNSNCVTSAKDLNFQRVIQEHATNAKNKPQKEHLSVIYRLLNRSATSTSHSTQKFDSRSEEETFQDADLEPGVELVADYYPGECLIREKFTGDGDTQRQDKTADESNAIASDDSHKDPRLLTRVFVEHLNSFLPNIENNRIFPLCNSRCADKIKTCSHVGDIQPKKRQPYIPPNLRLSRHKQSMEDSIHVMCDVDYNKTMQKSKPFDKELISTDRLIPRVSTISKDTTAAKWDHIGREDSDERLATSTSADGDEMQKIFEGHSTRVLQGDEATSNVRYHHDSFKTVGVSDEAVFDDRLLDQHTGNLTHKNLERAAKTEPKIQDGSQRNAVNAESMEARTDSPIDTNKTERREDLLRKTKSVTSMARHELGSTAHKTSFKEEKSGEFSAQQNLHSDRIDDGKQNRQLPHSRLLDANDDFGQSASSNSEQKTLFEEARLKESSATGGIPIDEASKIKPHDRSVTHKAKSEKKRTRVGDNETGSGAHAKSEESLTKLGSDRTETTENFYKEEIGYKLPVRSKEMMVGTKTHQQSLLNVRSERVLNKTSIGATSKGNVKMDGNETRDRLQVRSEENVRDLKGRGNKRQESKPTNEKLTLQARSEAFLVTTATVNKSKILVSENESLDKGNVLQDIRAEETGNNLNVRSENELLTMRGKDEELPSSLMKDRTGTPKLQARSMEMLTISKDVLKSSGPLRKANSEVANIAEATSNVDKDHTEPQLFPITPPSSQPTTTAKRQNVFEQHARSVEYKGTNYQLLKSSSEELLGSIKNQDYLLERNENWNSKTKLLDNFAVRSKELVGRTQSAIFEGQKDSRRRLNSSSKHCVDCTGSGYVLRARPSQPCDRCTVSLTKYPEFVDALANQDYHRREVTRTNDEWIKTDLINKTDGKLKTKPNQGSPSKETIGESKIGGKFQKAKRNADGNVGNSSATHEQRSTKTVDKNTKQNSDGNGDETIKSTKHSQVKSESTSGDKDSTSNTAQKIAEDLTISSLKRNGDESVTDELLLSGEIKKLVSASSLRKHSDDCTENASNTTAQAVNTIDEAGLSTFEPPVLDGCQTEKVINKAALGERSQLPTNYNRGEHLVFSTLIQTAKPYFISKSESKEMPANFENDYLLIPKETETKEQQHSTDEKPSSPMSGSSMNKSLKQLDEKNELITELIRRDQHTTAVHQSDDSRTGSPEVEIEDNFHENEAETLCTQTMDAECKSDESKSGSRDHKSEVDFGWQSSGKLNIAQSTQENTDSGNNQCFKASSGNINDITRSEATLDEKVVETNEKREETFPDSVNSLKETTGVKHLMLATNERVGIDHVDPSHAIGETITSQDLSSRPNGTVYEEATVPDDGQLNVGSTSNDKKFRESISDPQLSGQKHIVPVVAHLFPRSNEKMMAVNYVKGTTALDESEPIPKNLKGQTSDTATGSFKEKTERSDPSTGKIELQDRPSDDSNEGRGNDSIPLPMENSLTTTQTHDRQKPLDLQLSSRAVSHQIFLNVPSLAAVSDEYPVSQDNRLSEQMNDEKSKVEAVVSSGEVLPDRAKQNVRNDISSASGDGAIPLSEPLKYVSNEMVTKTTAQHDNQVPLSASLQQQEWNNDKRYTFAPPSADLVRVDNVDRKTRKSDLSPPRSNEITPIRTKDETKVEQQNEIICITKQEAAIEKGTDKESIEISVKKPIDNKPSVVLDEAFAEERNLHSDKQPVDHSDSTDIDQDLNVEFVGYFSDGNTEKDRRKVRVVNSTCCRRLLNNDELINRLSEKVLEKLANKIHCCGPNCKSPCGGLNVLLNAKNDNNLNWE